LARDNAQSGGGLLPTVALNHSEDLPLLLLRSWTTLLHLVSIDFTCAGAEVRRRPHVVARHLVQHCRNLANQLSVSKTALETISC